ncbi:MAG: TRAP transporter small permease [Deltaproteobacteria bacterium]|nr:TRAP transporter small permease [Deltaproteobacteria bacterium]
MNGFGKTVTQISRFLNGIAGISLIFLMSLTIIDVILRGFNKPILGAYEMVAFAGAVVIGFSMPQTATLRGHIYVDFLIARFSRKVRNLFNITTRLLVFLLLFLIGWNLFKFGWDLQRSGEVSLTLQMPFYPVAYGIGICCFIQCLAMVCDIIKIQGGTFDE